MRKNPSHFSSPSTAFGSSRSHHTATRTPSGRDAARRRLNEHPGRHCARPSSSSCWTSATHLLPASKRGHLPVSWRRDSALHVRQLGRVSRSEIAIMFRIAIRLWSVVSSQGWDPGRYSSNAAQEVRARRPIVGTDKLRRKLRASQRATKSSRVMPDTHPREALISK